MTKMNKKVIIIVMSRLSFVNFIIAVIIQYAMKINPIIYSENFRFLVSVALSFCINRAAHSAKFISWNISASMSILLQVEESNFSGCSSDTILFDIYK